MAINIDQLDNFSELTEEERQLAIRILNEYADTGISSTIAAMDTEDYDEIPVTITEFIHNRNYLGNALYKPDGTFSVYEYWQKKLVELFPTNTTTAYNTVVFTGAIGLGKTMIAVISLLYLLYRLLCLKDPYGYFGMTPSDKISISLINITIENAKGVALDKMNQMIQLSPWFLSHGKLRGRTNIMYEPDKHIEVICGSSNNQIIGRAIFASLEDEVNFSAMTTDIEKAKAKMKDLIALVDSRMKSRFLRGTFLPTVNFIVSSKNSDQSFLDEFINSKKQNESTTTMIVDEAQWIVDPRKDSKEHFYVAVGNKFLANEVLPRRASQDLIDEYRAKGYTMLEVPIGYYEDFVSDVDSNLANSAGISTASSLKYISGVKWNEIKSDSYQNPFTKEIIEVGINDNMQYSDFFDMKRVPSSLKARPLFIHLDMSVSGDKTGIAGVYIIGKQQKVQGDITTADMFYQLAFSVSIKAPKGSEISFDKNRAFIRWLREQGFCIRGLSADTFQSSQIRQELAGDGFEVDVISVDRLDPAKKICLPYAYFKSTIYDKRLVVYNRCDFLSEEIAGLERLSNGKIEHPNAGKSGCFTGDTKVSLLDGRELTLLELVDEYNSGKQNYVYSFNETTKKIEPKLIENAWCTRKNAELVEVTLDNGEVIRCTPNHRFMLRDGSYCEAQNLKPDDSLMPLYRKYPSINAMNGYRLYYEPIEDAWHYEHRQFATEVLDEKYLVHHKNCKKYDNTPTNLVWCSKARHQQIHFEMNTGACSLEANQKRSDSIRKWHEDNRNTEVYKERSRKLSEAVLNKLPSGYHEEVARRKEQAKQNGELIRKNAEKSKQSIIEYHRAIEEMFNVKWDDLSVNERDSYSVKYQRALNPKTQEVISKKISENHQLGKYTNAKAALQKENDLSKKLKELIPTVDKEKFFTIFGFEFDTLIPSKRPPYIVKYRKIVGKEILNHRVVLVKFLNETDDVYDLTIADNHNFALSSGIFVHNSKDCADACCGAIYNASLHSDQYSYEYGDDLNVMLDVSQGEVSKEQLVIDFEEELKKISNPKSFDKNISSVDLFREHNEYSLFSSQGIVIF